MFWAGACLSLPLVLHIWAARVRLVAGGFGHRWGWPDERVLIGIYRDFWLADLFISCHRKGGEMKMSKYSTIDASVSLGRVQ